MATFLNDTFTGANGTALTAHTGETGATWTIQSTWSDANIQTNRVYGSVAAVQASGVPASPDYDVLGTINIVSAANVTAGVAGRMAAAADTFYYAAIVRTSGGGGTWTVQVAKRVAGVQTTLSSTGISALTVGTDHTLRLHMVGSSISAILDETTTFGPTTDTAITAAGRAGIIALTETSTTGFHIADITATDVKPGKIFRVNQAVNRAAYF